MANVSGTEINLKPTDGMRTEAQRYKDWKKEGRAGGTQVAAVRATQILSGSELSADVTLRMFSFFSRHEVDKKAEGFSPGEKGYPSKGRVAWAAWGGDAGFSWSRGKAAAIKKARERAEPIKLARPKRLIPPAIPIDSLPNIDFVTVSHNHYDHLDTASLKEIYINNPNAVFLVPAGDKRLLQRKGIKNIFEYDWWDGYKAKNLEITFTPVQHWSKRGLFDRNKSLWGGWFFKFEDYSIFHAGDTGYSNDFKETKSRLGSPKYAFIPIGAYDPEWFMAESHVNPEDAVQIMLDLGAENSFGMHWATFKLTDEDTLEPKERLNKAISNINMDNFTAPSPGSIINLD